MAGQQSYESHAHRPMHTAVLWLMALVVLVLIGMQFYGYYTRDWAIVVIGVALLEVGWISRAYIVRLQDRIIMLEMKVRAAELLPAGQDAQLARLTRQQIVALRFASDEELGSLLDRAARENLAPKDIKAAIKTWRPDLYRT